jgi:phage FluMu gp28-like protein
VSETRSGTASELQQRALAAFVRRDRAYARDPWLFITEQVRTIDEAAQREEAPFPDKQYLQELVAAIDSEPMLAIPKSRRMLVTWTVAAWCVHRARYHRANAIFWQSETEDKSAYAIDKRWVYIEEHLTEPIFRRRFKTIRTSKGLVGRIEYEDTGSYGWAIPQGGKVGRAYTPSVWVSDETDFQEDAQESLVTALAFAEKGARLIFVSSSNGPRGVMADLCRSIGFVKFS